MACSFFAGHPLFFTTKEYFELMLLFPFEVSVPADADVRVVNQRLRLKHEGNAAEIDAAAERALYSMLPRVSQPGLRVRRAHQAHYSTQSRPLLRKKSCHSRCTLPHR